MKEKRLLIILLVMALLLATPVSGKMVTAKVDDKGLICFGNAGASVIGTLHTPYGTITVTDENYNKVEVNDTIRYDTHKDTFWSAYWDIEVIK